MKPKYIMIHHTAVSRIKCRDQFEANNRTHKRWWNVKSSLGFYLGYNYEIATNGTLNQARADGEITVACPQGNMNDGRCIHIALDGNFNLEKPAPSQVFALRDLLRRLVKKHGINKDNIVFHRDYANKSCPGENMDLVFVRSLVSSNALKEANEQKSDNKQEIIQLLGKLLELVKKL